MTRSNCGHVRVVTLLGEWQVLVGECVTSTCLTWTVSLIADLHLSFCSAAVGSPK